MSNSKTTSTETKLISINAALAERASRLETYSLVTSWTPAMLLGAKALKAQIRDLETEKHALLQTLPL